MRKLLKIAALSALAMAAGALTAQTTTYTGTVKDLSLNAVTSGQVTFTATLPTTATIPGTGVFVGSTVTCNINNDGSLSGFVGGVVSGACIVASNTALTPTGTAYKICIQPGFQTPGSCFYDYALQTTKDISTIVPTLSTGPVNYGGVPGPPLNFVGTWSSAVIYPIGVVVSFNNIIYISLTNANLNNTPSSSPLRWSGVTSPASLIASPGATQTVVQPTGTQFGVNGRLVLGGQTAPRTFVNPELSATITDTSPATTNGGAQADLRLTPFLHLELNDNAPNDAAPVYVAHNCNYTTGPPIANGACVAMVPIAVSSAGDEHAGIEAINAIAQVGSVDPLAQAQGIELNMFNNTGVDSLLLPSGSYSRGPYLGISSTAGGANRMVAAFNVQDQTPVIAPNSGWQYGLFVQRAIQSGILLAGSPVGLEQSATCGATSSTNCSSIPLRLDSNFWNGTSSQPFATQLSAFSPAGTNQPQCFSVSFTSANNLFTTCSDGSTTMQGLASIAGPVTIAGGSLFLGGNATDVEIGSTAATGSPYIDFHSSGNAVDYDARIEVTGGSGTLGNGTINLVGAHVETNGTSGLTHTVTVTCGTLIFTNGLLTSVTGSC